MSMIERCLLCSNKVPPSAIQPLCGGNVCLTEERLKHGVQSRPDAKGDLKGTANDKKTRR